MPDEFEVNQQDVKPFQRPSGRTIRVTPVNRLRVVMVQRGYRRMSTTQSNVVPTTYSDSQGTWYPGVELSGEGIFIDLPGGDPHPALLGKDQQLWFQQYMQTREPQDHPVFVWWHTYAHRIISALALDSGYSSAAIRERVFVKIDPKTNDAYGGALLYTAQPGGDGTLGGMVALVPGFSRILDSAELYVDACSNDPVCEENAYVPGKTANGAACYSCQLLSETSCEARNLKLDRNVLRRNLL